MADTQNQPQPMLYHIRIQGQLDSVWSDWLGDVTVTYAGDGTTLLICRVIDQAVLHGLLRQIRDLNLPLLSVNRVNPAKGDTSEVEE